MTQQSINIGSSPNSGDGDPIRTCFTKVNSNFTELYESASTAKSFPLTCSIPGSPASNVLLWYIPAVLVFTIPANFTGSLAVAGTSATSTSIFTLQYIRSGISTTLGSVTFSASSNVGVFSSSSSYTSQIGDILTLTSPSSSDATLANIGISILANKS